MDKEKKEKINEIRERGYSGAIPECRCGWIGTLHEVDHNEKGESCCPECNKVLASWFSLAGR